MGQEQQAVVLSMQDNQAAGALYVELQSPSRQLYPFWLRAVKAVVYNGEVVLQVSVAIGGEGKPGLSPERELGYDFGGAHYKVELVVAPLRTFVSLSI